MSLSISELFAEGARRAVVNAGASLRLRFQRLGPG